MPPSSSAPSIGFTGTSLLSTAARTATLSRFSVGTIDSLIVSVRAFFASVFRSRQFFIMRDSSYAARSPIAPFIMSRIPISLISPVAL
ncbi:hypothetical protein [Agathobaculum sp.]|uniref:hypothetical protein n=1 Tax=Agathobaculum sp. TaxID=2048138 RepID=UPI003520F477